jgi:hypothetical protein
MVTWRCTVITYLLRPIVRPPAGPEKFLVRFPEGRGRSRFYWAD